MLEVTGATTFNLSVPVVTKTNADTFEQPDYDDENSIDDDVSSHFSSHDDERSKASSENRSNEFMEYEVTGLLADTAYRYVVFLTRIADERML